MDTPFAKPGLWQKPSFLSSGYSFTSKPFKNPVFLPGDDLTFYFVHLLISSSLFSILKPYLSTGGRCTVEG